MRSRSLLSASVLFSIVTAATPVFADGEIVADEHGVRPVGAYEGVVPGAGHTPTHVRPRAGAHATVVTWPGYEPRVGAPSRFFLQLSSRPRFEAKTGAHQYTIVLKDVGITDRQSLLPLDTHFFQTPVTRAQLKKHGHDLEFVFELREDAIPTVTIEDAPEGYVFLFVEFPGTGNSNISARPAAAAAGPTGLPPAPPRSQSNWQNGSPPVIAQPPPPPAPEPAAQPGAPTPAPARQQSNWQPAQRPMPQQGPRPTTVDTSMDNERPPTN